MTCRASRAFESGTQRAPAHRRAGPGGLVVNALAATRATYERLLQTVRATSFFVHDAF